MSSNQISVSDSFELEIEKEGQVGRGVIAYGDKPPITLDDLDRHADGYENYNFHETSNGSFAVVHEDGFEGEYGEFESWRMAYGVDRIDEDKYLIWLRYEPRGEIDGHDASKPWKNIIENLGGD